MKKSFYILKDLAILFTAVLLMLFVGVGVTKLLKDRTKDKPRTARPVTIFLESTLKPLIIENIHDYEPVLEIPELDQSLDAIMDRLLSKTDPLPYDIEILVLNLPVVNAVTFPGGLIVVYSGLISRLESAEEMAAVLAHELGHVVYRDSMKNITRQVGFAALFSLFGGRGGRVLVQRIIREAANIHFSRSVESRADDFALDLLAAAEIDPNKLGIALTNLKYKKEFEQIKLLKYIDNHPEINFRIKKAYEKSNLAAIDEKAFDINWNEVKSLLPSVFSE